MDKRSTCNPLRFQSSTCWYDVVQEIGLYLSYKLGLHFHDYPKNGNKLGTKWLQDHQFSILGHHEALMWVPSIILSYCWKMCVNKAGYTSDSVSPGLPRQMGQNYSKLLWNLCWNTQIVWPKSYSFKGNYTNYWGHLYSFKFKESKNLYQKCIFM